MRSRTSSCTSATSFCFSSCIVVRPDLHSFPTRRSSDLLKRALELLLMPLAAAVVFVEDVLLHYLGLAMAALAKWPPVARVEAWLGRLPPWAALLAFVAPSTLVLPVKLAAVWFAFHHQYALSLASIVIGKMLATALVARLYRVLHPTLVTMSWFLRAETWL